MLGFNGGLIGATRTTSGLPSVPGVWSAREQLEAKRNLAWPSAGGDPYYSSVSLLLHGDGANNSTTFTDNSPSPKIATRFGDTKISTTQSKFGGSSIAFDGSGDYLSYSSVPAFNFGDGDFTIEMWYFFNTNSAGQALIRQHNNGDQFQFSWYSANTGTLNYYLSSTGNTWNIVSGNSFGNFVANTWYHLALVRYGNVFTPYMNGIAGTAVTSSATLFNSTANLTVGAGPGLDSSNGFMDDLRITKGVARYTANFSSALPSLPFPDF